MQVDSHDDEEEMGPLKERRGGGKKAAKPKKKPVSCPSNPSDGRGPCLSDGRRATHAHRRGCLLVAQAAKKPKGASAGAKRKAPGGSGGGASKKAKE